MTNSLERIQSNLIQEAKKGYPTLLLGCIVFLLFIFLPFLFLIETVYLIWIFGLGVIFPIGLLLSKLLGVNILTTGNPLGGIVAAPQAFYIPVFIIVYMHIPSYLPFTIGLLGGSHFLPYMWIYRSKAYLFVTLGVCLSSLIIGGFFVDQAFSLYLYFSHFAYLWDWSTAHLKGTQGGDHKHFIFIGSDPRYGKV